MGVYRRKKKGRLGKIWWITYMVTGHQRRESSQSTNKRVAQNLLAIRKAKVLEGQLQLPASRPPKFEDSEIFAKPSAENRRVGAHNRPVWPSAQSAAAMQIAFAESDNVPPCVNP